MIENLVSHIESYLKQHNLHILAFENKFEFKSHSIRNLITGKSKNPNLTLLVRLSEVLETPIDLLLRTRIDLDEGASSGQENHSNQSLQLFYCCFWTIFLELQKNDEAYKGQPSTYKTLSASKLSRLCNEIILYCEEAKDGDFDKTYALWKLKNLKY